MNLKEAKQFVADFVTGDHTPEEYAAFLRWLRGATAQELNAIADEHESMHEHWDVAGLVPSEEWKGRLEAELDRMEKEVPVREIGENWFMRRKSWVAAASVAVVLAGGAILFTQHKAMKDDSGRPELLAVVKTVVNPSGAEEKQLVKQVVLSDGSKVSLNVASTLKYPETFSGAGRIVELSGEAYFEVVPDASKPFRVLIKDAVVQVLGTHFNVRAYADEPASRTILIDGSVEMKSQSETAVLKPGQQAEIAYASTGAGGEIVKSEVDVNAVMGWMKGDFKYTDEGIYTVMQVISRYFNVHIQFDPGVPNKKGSGIVSKSNGLQGNLSLIRSSMGLNVSLSSDEKTVRVSL
ncbi:MAG TPA: FecR domain-containing protein [Puia sp.]|nr:FecR domain-containing protein [Puia sp.]